MVIVASSPLEQPSSYPPDQGTSLANIVATERLELAQEDDEARSGVDEIPYEHSRRFEEDLLEERARYGQMDYAHEHHIVNPQYAFIDSSDPATDVENAFVEFYNHHKELDTDTPKDVVRLRFYLNVYPQLQEYLHKITQDNTVTENDALENFLLGKDLGT